MDNVKRFEVICGELLSLYAEKNKRYGNTFEKQFTKNGLAMSVMRLEDKFNRFEMLSNNLDDDGGDESIEDTLKDLANYSIMTIMELRRQRGDDNAGT